MQDTETNLMNYDLNKLSERKRAAQKRFCIWSVYAKHRNKFKELWFKQTFLRESAQRKDASVYEVFMRGRT